MKGGDSRGFGTLAAALAVGSRTGPQERLQGRSKGVGSRTGAGPQERCHGPQQGYRRPGYERRGDDAGDRQGYER
jgi:hypothetical protein